MKIAIIGGGAAGLVAAGSAKNAEVVVFDHNDKLGKKIYITGKGRCNFTNVCDNETFLSNVVTNAPFLRSALSRFTPYDAVELIEQNGCKTKVERGRRAFPSSDKASDIIKALTAYAKSNNAEFRLGVKISDLSYNNEENKFSVRYDGGEERFDRVIVCAGGLSYPSTGSDGSAYRFVKKFGHKMISPVPSLVGLKTDIDFSSAEGLTLKNIELGADGVKPIFGDLMITRDGVSGPVALTMSAYLSRREKPYTAYIDFKPALTSEELDDRLLREFGAGQNKSFKNILDGLLPKSIIPFIIDRSGISPDKHVNVITRGERQSLVKALKRFEFKVVSTEGFERAVVTCGGVNVKEIYPKTMMSRLCRGLYICGEMLDVDALTGGYNLHIALATGFVAGVSASGDNYD